jgi:hypothetical protein
VADVPSGLSLTAALEINKKGVITRGIVFSTRTVVPKNGILLDAVNKGKVVHVLKHNGVERYG